MSTAGLRAVHRSLTGSPSAPGAGIPTYSVRTQRPAGRRVPQRSAFAAVAQTDVIVDDPRNTDARQHTPRVARSRGV